MPLAANPSHLRRVKMDVSSSFSSGAGASVSGASGAAAQPERSLFIPGASYARPRLSTRDWKSMKEHVSIIEL